MLQAPIQAQEQKPAERLLERLVNYDGILTSEYDLRLRNNKKSQTISIKRKKKK